MKKIPWKMLWWLFQVLMCNNYPVWLYLWKMCKGYNICWKFNNFFENSKKRNENSFRQLFHLMAGLSIYDMWLHSHVPTHARIYLGVLLLLMQNFIWLVNCISTLQQVCLVILLHITNLQLHVSWVYICRNPLCYIVFGSKYITVSHKNTWLSEREAKEQIKHFTEHVRTY